MLTPRLRLTVKLVKLFLRWRHIVRELFSGICCHGIEMNFLWRTTTRIASYRSFSALLVAVGVGRWFDIRTVCGIEHLLKYAICMYSIFAFVSKKKAKSKKKNITIANRQMVYRCKRSNHISIYLYDWCPIWLFPFVWSPRNFTTNNHRLTHFGTWNLIVTGSIQFISNEFWIYIS